MTCSQQGCGEPGTFLFTWPGNDQKAICATHADWMKKVAAAMGMHLQLIRAEESPVVFDKWHTTNGRSTDYSG